MDYLDIILEEMFKRVGAIYDPAKVHIDGWYNEHEWTKTEEDNFINWLAELLYSNKDARNKIMAFKSKNKKRCKDAANWFVFNYGWKTKI